MPDFNFDKKPIKDTEFVQLIDSGLSLRLIFFAKIKELIFLIKKIREIKGEDVNYGI